jgi:hypothetical protein
VVVVIAAIEEKAMAVANTATTMIHLKQLKPILALTLKPAQRQEAKAQVTVVEVAEETAVENVAVAVATKH